MEPVGNRSLHARLAASALHDVRHIGVLSDSDITSSSHGVDDLLREACFCLHCTKIENKVLSTRLTAARTQIDKKRIEVQCSTRRIGALEACLKALTAMHTAGVARATEEFRTRLHLARMTREAGIGPGTAISTPLKRREVLPGGASSTRNV